MNDTVRSTLARCVTQDLAPGVAWAVGGRRGATHVGAIGSHLPEGETPLATDAVFNIASMTKLVTSIAALRFIESGEIDLGTPAAGVLPALADVKVLTGFDGGGRPAYEPLARPITVQHLLTHSAGYGYHLWNPLLARLVRDGHLPAALSPAHFDAAPLVHQPGAGWTYGISTDWLGRLVEALSGEDLNDHFRRHVFEPLGMGDTGYVVEPGNRNRVVPVCVRQDDGAWRTAETQPDANPGDFAGGGGLFSTAADYLTLLRCVLGGGALSGTTLLSERTASAMFSPLLKPGLVGPAVSEAPAMSADFELLPGQPKSWGLGLLVNLEPVPGGRGALSGAWAGVFNTFFWLDPSRDVAAVLMMQSLPFCHADAVEVLGRFEQAVYA